jgi:membrane protein DedA with SNARE-associated domain
MDLTVIMTDIFGPYGMAGVVAMVFVAFLVDATVFPFLPEIFIIIGFAYEPTPGFAVILLLTAIIAECLGNTLLYCVVQRFGLPRKLKRVMNKYVSILIVSDERMMLLNRIAPMIPYSGAFISVIESWKLSRALFYIVIGCILKYGLILSMSTFFYSYFTSDVAQYVMIGFVVLILAISLIASYIRKKRTFPEEENASEV